MDLTLQLKDLAAIAATLLSPLIAVQVTRYLDRRNAAMARKLDIFKALMATRSYRLLPAHIEALNSIELEFSPRSKNEALVVDAWHVYREHLVSQEMEEATWRKTQDRLLSSLLKRMGGVLGYSFSEADILANAYAPLEHGLASSEADSVRHLTVEVLNGLRPLLVRVHDGSR